MKNILKYLPLLFVVGCAGMQRDCQSCGAQTYGSDWVIVQYQNTGRPINCWKLHSAAVSNEQGSDGIFWQDTSTGHLVHISGWYNRVQVSNGDYASAAKLLDVDVTACNNGKYHLKDEE